MKSKLIFVAVVSLVCLDGPDAAAETPVIPAESGDWKYQDQGISTDGNWRVIGFDDSGWGEGQALLGYGDRDIRTRLSFGGNPQNKRRVAFFRRRFRAPGRHRLYLGRICCDDGAVVYVNGKEVQRFNMPGGVINSNTQALTAVGSNASDERKRHPFLIEQPFIQTGDNIVAVSVHQANPTSSDLAFDLEVVGLQSDDEIEAAQLEVATHAQTEETREANVGVSPVFHFNVKPR